MKNLGWPLPVCWWAFYEGLNGGRLGPPRSRLVLLGTPATNEVPFASKPLWEICVQRWRLPTTGWGVGNWGISTAASRPPLQSPVTFDHSSHCLGRRDFLYIHPRDHRRVWEECSLMGEVPPLAGRALPAGSTRCPLWGGHHLLGPSAKLDPFLSPGNGSLWGGGKAVFYTGSCAGLLLIVLVLLGPLQLSETPKGERYNQLLSALTSHKDR